MEATNTSITQQLEGFLNSARQLEVALRDEKQRSQKLLLDSAASRTALENNIRELQNRLLQRENKIQAISEAFRNLQVSETRLKNELTAQNETAKKTCSELAEFQSAWNQVLEREAQARGTLIDYENTKRALTAQKNQTLSLEKSLKELKRSNETYAHQFGVYERELQNALMRIKNEETKSIQIQETLTVEKEQLKLTLENNFARNRELFRSAAQEQMRVELERTVQREKKIQETITAELDKVNREQARFRERLFSLTEELTATKMENQQVLDAKRSLEITLLQRARDADNALVSAKNECAMKQIEVTQNEVKLETIKKESNKALLMEQLRHEADIQKMAKKINSLMTYGIYAEKIDAAPESETVYTATSISLNSALLGERTLGDMSSATK